MSKDIERGLREAFKGALEGAILSAILPVLSEAVSTLPDMPSYSKAIFQLLEVAFLVGSILEIPKIESMRVGYLIGWLIGMWVMSSVGLVESWLFIVCAIVGIATLIGKISRGER